MNIIFENEIDDRMQFEFDYMQIAKDVCNEVLSYLKCPYDCEINVYVTDNENIRIINNDTRNIDKETDVLSFPNLFFDEPAAFDIPDEELVDCVNPETDMIVLGDIILSYDRILSQAEDYGHSIKREYAFLITHSMLHLCGYDHMEADEAKVMEELQELILNNLGIFRE